MQITEMKGNVIKSLHLYFGKIIMRAKRQVGFAYLLKDIQKSFISLIITINVRLLIIQKCEKYLRVLSLFYILANYSRNLAVIYSLS